MSSVKKTTQLFVSKIDLGSIKKIYLSISGKVDQVEFYYSQYIILSFTSKTILQLYSYHVPYE